MEQEDLNRLDLWKKGHTDSEIASICKVSKWTIRSWRQKNGLDSNNKGQGNYINNEEEETRLKLFKEGYSDSEIGAIVGVTGLSIYQWRKRRGLTKSKKDLSEKKVNDLSLKEETFFQYLKNKYPHRNDLFLLSLVKYAEPQSSSCPSPKQREFINKIKVPGFKTVYYFDDGEYNCTEKAMNLFIVINYNCISENIGKIQANMTPSFYKLFIKQRDYQDEETCLKLFKEGYTDSEIGAIVGVTGLSIYQWRKRRGLTESKKGLSEKKVNDLSLKEETFFQYLKNKYPHRNDLFLLSLVKYVEPQSSSCPSPEQREFINKIKVPGFKTVYYFDDGEYNCTEKAMNLFIVINYNYMSENIGKIQANMTPSFYKLFIKQRDKILFSKHS